MPIGFQLGLQMAVDSICIMTVNDMTCCIRICFLLSCDLELPYVLASRSTFPARATSLRPQPRTHPRRYNGQQHLHIGEIQLG